MVVVVMVVALVALVELALAPARVGDSSTMGGRDLLVMVVPRKEDCNISSRDLKNSIP
jgi:hypothetical protein